MGGEFGPLDVGIRLKGGVGSFRPLTKKAAFKVKFDEYVEGQTLLGLKKLTLNNMVQDPSMIHETLGLRGRFARRACRPRGRATPTCAVNGEDYGLYLDVETLDKVSLPRLFASTQHLYEAGLRRSTCVPGRRGAYEIDEGDEERPRRPRSADRRRQRRPAATGRTAWRRSPTSAR